MPDKPRTTNADFWNNFESLLMWGSKAFTLCPFLVARYSGITVYPKLNTLLEDWSSEDDLMIVQAWPGEYRTDYFQYKMSTLKRHLDIIERNKD